MSQVQRSRLTNDVCRQSVCKLQLSLVATLQIDAKTAMRDCLHDYSPFCRDTAALQQSAVCQYSAAQESDLRHRATALAILTYLRIMPGTSLGKWVFNFEKMLPCSLVFTVFSRGRHLFTPHDRRWSGVSARRRGTRCKICAADSGLADTRRRNGAAPGVMPSHAAPGGSGWYKAADGVAGAHQSPWRRRTVHTTWPTHL